MNIAVLGYGTVGSGVVEVLTTNRETITKRAGESIDVKYVLDLRDFPGDPIQEKIVHDYQPILDDPDVKIVVEVMGGVEPAYTFVKKALQAGKSVATSNKGWWLSVVQNCWPLPMRRMLTSFLRPVSAAVFRSFVH